MTLRGRQICSSGLQLFISPLKSHLMLLQQSWRAPASVSLHPVFQLKIGPGETFISRWPTSLRAGPKSRAKRLNGCLCHVPPQSPRRPLAVSNDTPLLSPSQLNKVQTCLRRISADDQLWDKSSIHICLGSLVVLAHGSFSAKYQPTDWYLLRRPLSDNVNEWQRWQRVSEAWHATLAPSSDGSAPEQSCASSFHAWICFGRREKIAAYVNVLAPKSL